MDAQVSHSAAPQPAHTPHGPGPQFDADVVVVGAGPVGLFLAAELRLAGINVVVLERRAGTNDTPRAGGLAGHVLELLRHRGLLERFEQAATLAYPAPIFPFGEMHIDFTALDDPPLTGLVMPQSRTEELLEQRLSELGGSVRRGHALVGLSQDDGVVIADVDGPGGVYRLAAQYLVGCDGGRSTVRKLAGMGFPGITYPEVHRLADVAAPQGMVLHGGELDVPGVGPVAPGFTRTEHGVFAFAQLQTGRLVLNTVVSDEEQVDDSDAAVTTEEFAASMHRVLGGAIPLQDPRRLTRYRWHARKAGSWQAGNVLLAGDAAHLLPSPGTSICVGCFDAVNLGWKLAATLRGWAPTGLLESYETERDYGIERAMLQTQAQVALRRGLDPAADALRTVFQALLQDEPAQRRLAAWVAHADLRYPLPGGTEEPLVGTFAPNLALHTTGGAATSVAQLMEPGRPVILDLAERPELRDLASAWADRVDLHRVTTLEPRPADLLVIRPDGVVAWAAPRGAAIDAARPGLASALAQWFGVAEA